MNITNPIHMNRLRLKKNALNKKLEYRVFQTEIRADFLNGLCAHFEVLL